MGLERLAKASGQPRHVLIVRENRDPLPMLVRPYTLEALQHFIALDGQPPGMCVTF